MSSVNTAGVRPQSTGPLRRAADETPRTEQAGTTQQTQSGEDVQKPSTRTTVKSDLFAKSDVSGFEASTRTLTNKARPGFEADAAAQGKAKQAELQFAAGVLGLSTTGKAKSTPIQAGQALSQATSRLQGRLQSLAKDSPEKFKAALKQIYGDKLGPEKLNGLLEQASKGEFPLPKNIRFVDPKTLQGNNAAYSEKDGGTILLSRDLANDPKALQAALTEEAGHHLDQRLGGGDTQGDEGQLFLSVLQKGGPVSPAELASARLDDDKGTITLDGKQEQVEFQSKADEAYKAISKELGGLWISDSDAKDSFNLLLKLNPDDFNKVLKKLTAGGIEKNKLNVLINQLGSKDQKLLTKLLKKVADDGTYETGRLVLKNVNGQNWSRLLTAVKGLDSETQTSLIDAFGGAKMVESKNLYEYFAAQVRGDVNSADKIKDIVKKLVSFPGLPKPIKEASKAAAAAAAGVIKAFAGVVGEAILKAARKGESKQDRFISFLQAYGIDRTAADYIAGDVTKIYR